MADPVRPDPQPFFLDGGPTGVLLIHGYTGSPPEMRLVGEYLHERGLTVSGPLLPGHGTTADDLNRCRWPDWANKVEAALDELGRRCETLFVAGLSLGALLTVHLAARTPELAGAVLYAPPVIQADRRVYGAVLGKYFVAKVPKSGRSSLTDPAAHERLWHYDEHPLRAAHEVLKLAGRARRLLPRVGCPLLVVCTTLDHYVHPRSGRYILGRAASTDSELLMLHNSGHALTVDTEWELVAEKTSQFIQAHSS